jgi:SPP1 gp7 family putative phage head morphogenesis protein
MKLKMAPETELQRHADALAADMFTTLSGILRRATAALESTITAAAERPERVILDQARAAWRGAVNDHFFPRVVDEYVGSAERTHLQLVTLANADVPFVSQSAAVAYLIDAANRMVGVTEGTWARARAQLIEGFRAGESTEQLATRLQGVTDWSRSRAETVARTEIISASNAGALDEIMSTGVIAKKTWLATKDDRTREAHRKANGQTVSVNNVFIVCGEALAFPGDPQGEPGCVINCRCTMTFDVKKSELTLALDDLPDVTDEFDPANFVDLDSLTAAVQLNELARRPFDESKVNRDKGRFAPKPGSGKKISYKKPAKKAAPKIDYTKPAKKAAPPPAKKTAPAPTPPPAPAPTPAAPAPAPTPPPPTPAPVAPPPAKKSAKKVPGKKTAPAAPPPPPTPEPEPEPDDITIEPTTGPPSPAAPLVQVDQDVLDSLSVAEGVYALPGDRVVVGNRAGTVRVADAGSDGLNENIRVQFDDSPQSLENVSPDAAQVIEDSDGFEDILAQPFGIDALAGDDFAVATAPPSAGADSEIRGTPFLDVDEDFPRASPAEMDALQQEMLDDEPWTSAEQSGLVTYTGSSYRDMNNCLRFDEGCDDDVETLNENATAGMRPLPRGVTTFRGANLQALGVGNVAALEGMVGAVVRDPGFSSSSIDSEVAESFTHGSSAPPPGQAVLMQIETPAGAPAAYVENITENTEEYELVMPPSTRYEILEVIPPATDGDPSVVRLRVVV